jgi:hypothetical protein
MQQTLERLRSEFLEMPGLRLTRAQVARLCGIERALCQGVLDALVDTGFLTIASDGCYMRSTGDPALRPRAAKAAMRAGGRGEQAS